MQQMKKQLNSSTSIIHNPYVAPAGFDAFSVAIHHASTVVFKNVAAMRANSWQSKSSYTYGLHGTPTSFILEERLASIENGKFCLLAPSGLAAIALINLAFLKSGDDVLIPDNVYNPNREMGQWLASHFGVSARFYDPMVGAGLADLLRPNTKLVWVEAPGSISMEVPDVPVLCAAAHAKGALVVIDNTWSAGIAFSAFEHGADIIMQALTKYQCGGSDVLMGAVITRDEAVNAQLQNTHMRLGFGVGMDDVYLILRNLPSLRLRFNAHDQSARHVANWLQSRPEISRVLHPALSSCPGHEIWKRDFTGAGGLFSVLFDETFSSAKVDHFVDSLKLFKIGYSWGGANSLCLPYRIEKMREQWTQRGILVRFNIGLEDTEDLIADIEQALAKMHTFNG
jgi:cystathionine beta-lyase